MIKKSNFYHHLDFHSEVFPQSALKLMSPDQATGYSSCLFQGLRPLLFTRKFKFKYFHKSPGMTQYVGCLAFCLDNLNICQSDHQVV